MVSQGTLPPKLNQQVHSHLAVPVPVGAAGDSSASPSLPLASQDANASSQEGPTLVLLLRHPVL